jgi:hypothetical protein
MLARALRVGELGVGITRGHDAANILGDVELGSTGEVRAEVQAAGNGGLSNGVRLDPGLGVK